MKSSETIVIRAENSTKEIYKLMTHLFRNDAREMKNLKSSQIVNKNKCRYADGSS